MIHNELWRKAAKIAKNELYACDTSIGFCAGTHHFVDLWARDVLFATFGANRRLAKKTIETFLHFQRTDGLIPFCIMRSKETMGKYLGKPVILTHPKSRFRYPLSGGLVPDGGLLIVIASWEYFKKSNDQQFLMDYYQSLKRALDWYTDMYDLGLIREWFLCEWSDAVLKSGATLYTNVLYIKALNDMINIATYIGDHASAKTYTEHAKVISKRLQSTFWNGLYLSDWYDYKRHDFFASHQNFLSIWFDVVGRAKAEKILVFAKAHCVMNFTVDTNYPIYPPWRIPLPQRLLGIKDYHNRGCLWLQPGIFYALSLWKLGYKREAYEFFDRIAKQIVQYKGVYEVYERDGKPVKRWFYTSEHPFAWSCGLYLYAFRILSA